MRKMQYSHSCKACCNGAIISCAAAEEGSGINQLMTTNLPLVAVATHENSQQLHPCDCMHCASMRESLSAHPHPRTHIYSHTACCMPSNIHADAASYHEPVQMSETLRRHAPHSHTCMIQYPDTHMHAHHHQRSLALPDQHDKSLDLVRKFGTSDYMCGSARLALSSPVVIDAQPLAMCRGSASPICHKLPALTNNAHAEAAPFCASHLCNMKPAFNLCTDQAAPEICHHQIQAVEKAQTCQIHPHCIAPVSNSSVKSCFTAPMGKALQMQEIWQAAPQPSFQAPPKVSVAAPTYEKVSVDYNCKQPQGAEIGEKKGDDFCKGVAYNQTYGGDGGDRLKGGSFGRGSGGNGWRGGCNARGRGSNNQTNWGCGKDENGGNEDARPAGGRGRGRGRCGWQQNKRRKEGDDDWEGSKLNGRGDKNTAAQEGSEWRNPNTTNNACNGWGNPDNNTNGW